VYKMTVDLGEGVRRSTFGPSSAKIPKIKRAPVSNYVGQALARSHRAAGYNQLRRFCDPFSDPCRIQQTLAPWSSCDR
jgi:hypothetical protein